MTSCLSLLLALQVWLTSHGGDRKILLAHYMPWFQSKEIGGSWGWHWTMDHFDPDRTQAGRQEAASQYRPLIGLYDSSDPMAIECQLQLMKLAGIDGVLIDWYGIAEAQDYGEINRTVERLVGIVNRFGMKFGIVFEDRSIEELVRLKKISANEAVSAGSAALKWLDDHAFGLPSYLNYKGQPVLLDFGPMFFKQDSDWKSMFAGLVHRPAFFTLQGKTASAVGAFGWPEPQVGDAQSRNQVRNFYKRGAQWPAMIGVAYPRFADIYKQAGVGPGYGSITDRDGATYRETLGLALSQADAVVQIATWNDWGEGTQIEPSVEFGYRDLEVTQMARKHSDPSFHYRPEDLRLPIRLYSLRKKNRSDVKLSARLTFASYLLGRGDFATAKAIIDRT